MKMHPGKTSVQVICTQLGTVPRSSWDPALSSMTALKIPGATVLHLSGHSSRLCTPGTESYFCNKYLYLKALFNVLCSVNAE